MPWVKFLWESYCQCLELLRTNVRVERLYHDIAQQAFRFCLKYQRKTEFRKLCDKLRNHLELVLKQTPSPVTINLNNADTQQMNLDTRLCQLDAAIQMELWQEAYKAIEDIHGLMTLSKKVFQPKMMANYYQKLALVFWKCGNYLFHAAAIFKHFQLTREMKKNISSEELGKMASRVLAAVLAVPIPSHHPEFDKFIETDRTPQEKMARLAVLLSLQQPPTRQSLIKDAARFGIVQAATQPLQDLYQWLEVDFHPLKLCDRVQTTLKFVESSEDMSLLQQYLPALREITLVRLLKQVAQVYQSICFERLLHLAPFADAFTLERVIVDCVRHNDMQVRIDHRTRTVHFGTDLADQVCDYFVGNAAGVAADP
jgi:translation initiation factor 3 subunit A